MSFHHDDLKVKISSLIPVRGRIAAAVCRSMWECGVVRQFFSRVVGIDFVNDGKIGGHT